MGSGIFPVKIRTICLTLGKKRDLLAFLILGVDLGGIPFSSQKLDFLCLL